MNKFVLYPVGSSDSCQYAAIFLTQEGFTLTDHPSPDITHLLLDTPTFNEKGLLRNGTSLQELLRMLPESVTVIGGNLRQDYLCGYRTIDLLQDPYYLAKNAAITAECALHVAAQHMQATFADSTALILGWGRIGKCLAKLLSALGCSVTVAARKESDRAMLESFGYRAVDFSQVPQVLQSHTLLFNTVPAVPLHSDILTNWSQGVALDLASDPGMAGTQMIPARGLPGKYAPESAGKLIAGTITRFYKEGTL